MKETKTKGILEARDYEVFELNGYYGYYDKHHLDTQHHLEIRSTYKEAKKDADFAKSLSK